MNWAVAIVGAEVLWSSAYWIYAARHKYMKESSGLLMMVDSIQGLDGQVIQGVETKQHLSTEEKAKKTESDAN